MVSMHTESLIQRRRQGRTAVNEVHSLSLSLSFLPSSILANIGHWNRWGISFPLTDIEANKAAAVVKEGGRIHKERERGRVE